jgi:osmotically-inducible protein OsmY
MRVFLALIVGILLGAAALWFYGHQNDAQVQQAKEQVQTAATNVGRALEEEIKVLHLRPQEVKGELAGTGQVVRKKAQEVGKAIADATADARTTATIKGKLLANRDLASLSISVNTTAGVVTLSGSVPTVEDISKAMVIAMQTDGVREVISTLQVAKPK